MAIALVTSRQDAPGANGGSTTAIDTTGADLLVLVVHEYSGGSHSTPSDSKSNTWTGLTVRDNGSLTRTRIYYAKNPTVGSGHTFTYSASGSFPLIQVLAFSGADLSAPFDQENGTTGSSASAAPGSVTPGVDNEALVAAVCNNGGITAVGSSFTLELNMNTVAGVNMGGATAYKVQTSAGAENPAFTLSASPWSAVIATFKAAGGGGGATIQALDQGMLTGGLSTLCGGLI